MLATEWLTVTCSTPSRGRLQRGTAPGAVDRNEDMTYELPASRGPLRDLMVQAGYILGFSVQALVGTVVATLTRRLSRRRSSSMRMCARRLRLMRW